MTDPAISKLDDFLASKALVLAVRPTDTGLDSPSAIDILISDSAGDLRLTVFDEYGDATTGDPRLLCVLCSREMGEIEDAVDFNAWACVHGLALDETSFNAYRRNRDACAGLIAALGDWPDVISDLDWQLDAGPAQALRRQAREPR